MKFTDWWADNRLRYQTIGGAAEAAWYAALKSVESPATVRRVRPCNSASTKIPLDELKRYRELFSHSCYCDYDNSVGASAFVDFIERKLRAGG